MGLSAHISNQIAGLHSVTGRTKGGRTEHEPPMGFLRPSVTPCSPVFRGSTRLFYYHAPHCRTLGSRVTELATKARRCTTAFFFKIKGSIETGNRSAVMMCITQFTKLLSIVVVQLHISGMSQQFWVCHHCIHWTLVSVLGLVALLWAKTKASDAETEMSLHILLRSLSSTGVACAGPTHSLQPYSCRQTSQGGQASQGRQALAQQVPGKEWLCRSWSGRGLGSKQG